MANSARLAVTRLTQAQMAARKCDVRGLGPVAKPAVPERRSLAEADPVVAVLFERQLFERLPDERAVVLQVAQRRAVSVGDRDALAEAGRADAEPLARLHHRVVQIGEALEVVAVRF